MTFPQFLHVRSLPELAGRVALLGFSPPLPLPTPLDLL